MLTLQKYASYLLPIGFLVVIGFQLFYVDLPLTNIGILFIASLLGLFFLFFEKNLFLSLCIFFVPISINLPGFGGINMSSPSEPMVFLLAVTALVIGIYKPTFFKKIIFHPISIVLALDVVWMVIASLYSEMYLYSLKRVFARVLFLLVFYLLAAQWMVKKENFIKFIFLYALGLLVPIILTQIKHSKYNFDPRTVYELCMPYFNDHTIYGACIAFVLPFMLIVAYYANDFGFSKKSKGLLWILFGIFVAAEILAFSRAAWLSLGVSFGMFIFLKLKLRFWHFLIGLSVVVSIGYFSFDTIYEKAKENENVSNRGEIGEHLLSVGNLNTDASNLERVNRWFSAYRMFQDRPITGFGPGTYQFVYGPYQSVYEMTYISTINGDRGNAHSEPLTYLSESGLPGLISYLIWTVVSICFGIEIYRRTKDKVIKHIVMAALLGFITFFFHGMVNSFIDQVKVSSLVFGSLAIFVVADLASKLKGPWNETENH